MFYKCLQSRNIPLRFSATASLVLFFAIIVSAEHLPVTIYTSADGLGSSFVDYLTRDSRGFMWFCTRDGLSRFDGARFVTYQIGVKDSPPGIESIFETRDGKYFVTTTVGTFRFDSNQLSQPDAVSPRINAEFITGMRGFFFEDSRGNVWFASGRLFRVTENEGKPVFEKYDIPTPPNMDAEHLSSDISETADGSLWLNATQYVIRLLPDNRTVFYPIETALSSGNTALMADKDGYVWMTRNNRLFVLKPELLEEFAGDEKTVVKQIVPAAIVELQSEGTYVLPEKSGEMIQYTGQKNNPFIEKSYSKKFFQSSDGNVWLTADNYLLQFSNGILHLHDEKKGLPPVMAKMAEDAAGNLWIGSYTGLARINRNGLTTYGAIDGAHSSRFFAINQSTDGTLYFASHDYYINQFDGINLKSVRPNIPPNSNFLWTSRYSYLDSAGNWWFLTGDKLYRFDGVTNIENLKTESPTHVYSKADGLSSDRIFQIFESSKGDIWVSTRDDGEDDKSGASQLKKGEDKFHTFTKEDGLSPGKSFSSAIEDFYGNIWFSFYEGGLARFNGERFDYFGTEYGLPANALPDLYVDKKGRLWIASAVAGLYRLDDVTAKNPEFVHLTTAEGLTSNNIRTIAEDNLGRIYLGSVRGVDRLSPDTGKIKHYSVNDGLAADFVIDSHRDKDGNLWFATSDGVSRLIPEPEETLSAPQIFLDNLRIAGEQQAIPQLGATKIDKGELSSNQNNLQIDFFGLDFRAGETLRYQYRLEGADESWSPPSEQRTRTFANLAPGDYRFLVRAVNSEGIVSENPAVISFKILSPIWQRGWFILLCAVFIVAVIILFYRYRTANLRAINTALTEANLAEENLRRSKEERLAELEKVRSRIATDLHDDIGASLTQIAVLSEVARTQSNGNGAGESLTRISDVSNELVEAMSDIVWSINPKKDHLSDLTQRMRRFASDVLRAKGIAFQFHTPETDSKVIVNTNLRREMFLVFKELINNIVKHSDADKVLITLKITGSYLILQITDNGKGFDSTVFDPRGTTDAQLALFNSASRGGNGLRSMWRRAYEINGAIVIDSKIGRGTKTTLSLPLDAATQTDGEDEKII